MQSASYLKFLKTTLIVNGRMALRTERLNAARDGAMGTQVMTIEHAASRLAGGFLQIIDLVTLRGLVSSVLETADLGELNPMRKRPGMPNACASTLLKYWLSGIDRDHYASSKRIGAILALEDAVMEVMPANLMRPSDLVELAVSHISHAPMIFGDIVFKNMTDLHPVWRPLLDAFASVLPVTWDAGPRQKADFLGNRKDVVVKKSAPSEPIVAAVSCASDRHEVIEAVRWVREMTVSGVDPSDIAVATVSLQTYDDLMASVAAEADVVIHMANGIPALMSRSGQTAAALADVMLRGISQKRISRLFGLMGAGQGALINLPANWEEALPADAALTTVKRWTKALERRPSTQPLAEVIVPLLDIISKGPDKASEIGERILWPDALAIWKRALKDGPPTALDRTLKALKTDDSSNPLSSACFMSAEDLAASPRSHVRLIGLTSRNWPRHQTEDALIPRHIVPSEVLDPMPLSRVDRIDFATISDTTDKLLVLSWPRRDGKGRDLGISGLVDEDYRENAVHLNRSRIANHAMSETDRLLSRPLEFRARDDANAVISTARDWLSADMTAHDGLVSAGHPRIATVLSQVQSATSLRKMLRDPLGFVWRYGLGFKAPEYEDEPLLLDSRQFGNIVHEILRRTVENLGRKGGFTSVSQEKLFEAIADARLDVGGIVETSQPVPPALIWFSTMEMAELFARAALTYPLPVHDGIKSFAEVPFGKEAKWIRSDLPWEQDVTVEIPGTGIFVGGVIDRLDLLSDGSKAYVLDYKSGKTPPKIEEAILNGGKELQRPIYNFAVKTLLGDRIEVESALIYPMTSTYAPLPEADHALDLLAGYVATARSLLLEGAIAAGIDAEDSFSESKFALPSQADAVYLQHKRQARAHTLSELTTLWSQP